MKKLFFLLAASAALFMFTGCDPETGKPFEDMPHANVFTFNY